MNCIDVFDVGGLVDALVLAHPKSILSLLDVHSFYLILALWSVAHFVRLGRLDGGPYPFNWSVFLSI